jgi:hypothetical protein
MWGSEQSRRDFEPEQSESERKRDTRERKEAFLREKSSMHADVTRSDYGTPRSNFFLAR